VELREGESIFKGALDLCQERGCQASQPLDETALIESFDLFGHGLGREGETRNVLGDDRVTRRKVGGVLGQWDNDHELAVLIDAIIGENDHRPGLLVTTMHKTQEERTCRAVEDSIKS